MSVVKLYIICFNIHKYLTLSTKFIYLFVRFIKQAATAALQAATVVCIKIHFLRQMTLYFWATNSGSFEKKCSAYIFMGKSLNFNYYLYQYQKKKSIILYVVYSIVNLLLYVST